MKKYLLISLLLVGCGKSQDHFVYVGCSASRHSDGVLISCPDGTTGFIPYPTSSIVQEPTPTPEPSPLPTPKHDHDKKEA